jgi:DNA-binding transcriptional LysR family regulator
MQLMHTFESRLPFTLAQAECFTTLADEKHFGRAAMRMSLTQPAMSRQIQALERALGVSLFTRSSRAVSLTEAGRAFLPGVERMLEASESAAHLARAAARGAAGSISIGFTVLAALTELGGWMRKIRAELPDVQTRLVEMVTVDQLAALESDRLDLAVVRGLPYRRGIEGRVVQQEGFILAVPAGHPLARAAEDPTLEQICEHDVVDHSPTNAAAMNDKVRTLLYERGLSPRRSISASQVHTAVALVNAGLGVAIVPASTRRISMPSVAYRSIVDLPIQTELCLAWRSHDRTPLTAAVRSLILDRP